MCTEKDTQTDKCQKYPFLIQNQIWNFGKIYQKEQEVTMKQQLHHRKAKIKKRNKRKKKAHNQIPKRKIPLN